MSRAERAKVTIGLLLGPLMALLLLGVGPPADMPTPAWSVVALTVWMAVWWILEPVPMAVTALLPVALLPLLGVGDINAAAVPYSNPLIFLFLGGFMLAEAIQRWNLHRRIALGVLSLAGKRPDTLVAGFMAATAFLSMWVSNTATAALMVPIGISVLSLLERDDELDTQQQRAVGLCLMLGIALAANIGGMGTLIGTPPNALLAGFMGDNYGINIGFAQWMLVAIPPALLMLAIAWWLLTYRLYPVPHSRLSGINAMLSQQAQDLGRMSGPEVRVAMVFALVALAWITRPLLEQWSGLTLSDGGIAVMGALLLFVVPARWGQRQFLLDWDSARNLPWGVLLLVGGGLALVYGNPGAGLLYDATLHAIFVGFVFSMIFGHAPVIFPSVLGVSIPYRPWFYVHVGLLHGGLLLRVAGDLLLMGPLRRWGSWLNVVAILLFLGATAFTALTATDDDEAGPSAGHPTRVTSGDDSATDANTVSKEIPDLQLSTDKTEKDPH